MKRLPWQSSVEDQPAQERSPEYWVVLSLLMIWLTHLLIYVVLVPPWQHYDEPTHFEYAATIRELGRVPAEEERLPELRRAIAISMLESGFYQHPAITLAPPPLNGSDIFIGIDQRRVPPTYYILVALATLPLRGAPIVAQLYAARLTSVVLALGFFAAAYATLRLITGVNWQLRCSILAVLVLQPAFVDNMSSVNSDVLANAVAVLLLLAGAAFIKRPTWSLALAGLGVCLLAVNVKRTLLAYTLLLPVAWLLALPRRVRRFVMVSLAAGLIVLLFAILVLSTFPVNWSGAVGNLNARVFGEQNLSAVLDTLLDPAWIARTYPHQILLLYMGAWGVFGWGEVRMPLVWFVVLGALVLASLFGVGRFTWRTWRVGSIQEEAWHLRVWWLCLFAVVCGWGAALLRVHSQSFPGHMFWSFGRYSFVSILPSALVLMVGLRHLVPAHLREEVTIGVIGLLLIFAVAALLGTVMPYYASIR